MFDSKDDASRMDEDACGDFERFGAGGQEGSLLALNERVSGIKGEFGDVFDLSF